MSDHSPEYKKYLASPDWQARRNKALDRAGHKCQVCSRRMGLDVHHNSYERLGHEVDTDLTVLCRRCHDLYHNCLPKPRAELVPTKGHVPARVDELVIAQVDTRDFVEEAVAAALLAPELVTQLDTQLALVTALPDCPLRRIVVSMLDLHERALAGETVLTPDGFAGDLLVELDGQARSTLLELIRRRIGADLFGSEPGAGPAAAAASLLEARDPARAFGQCVAAWRRRQSERELRPVRTDLAGVRAGDGAVTSEIRTLTQLHLQALRDRKLIGE